MMTAEELIQQLQLKPHPEGGFYRETFRATEKNGAYNLGTAIYFLISKDNVSNFHRIQQDELWFHHYGAPLDIHLLENERHTILPLGMPDTNCEPYQLVPKNTIFGSCLHDSNDDFALVSCIVIPGFEFKDFELFTYKQLIEDFPDFSEIIRKLTPSF